MPKLSGFLKVGAHLFLLAGVTILSACGTLRFHRQLNQSVGVPLSTGIGGTVFRLNKSSDLPNVFGRRDIYGGQIDRGFAEMKLVGIEGDTLILDVVDINRHSSETVMDRYKPFPQRGAVNVDVQQSTNFKTELTLTPTRIRFDTKKQKDIVISGIKITFVVIRPYNVGYKLEDTELPQ